MATVKDIDICLSAVAPGILSESWDNDGVMLCKDKNKNVVMDKEYLDHAVFNSLAEAAVFYRRLSSNVMSFVPLWVKNHTIINYDSYFFEAIANSIISIKAVIEFGHITDAKALLRNLYDEIIINCNDIKLNRATLGRNKF